MSGDSPYPPLLPKLGDITSPALEEAVVRLVADKHACDELARRHCPLASAAGYGVGLWTDSFYIPEGFAFFREMFPFAQTRGTERGAPALVPTRRTIGDAHRRHPEAMLPKQEETVLAFLQHPDRSVWGNKECATYTWIRPLGLFLAGEGKNRVSLFQRLGIEWIPACVSVEDYPAPERIVLYFIKGVRAQQCWAVLDGRMAEQLANPMWALPVLEAYGIKVECRWPRKFPSLDEVVRAHNEIADDQPGKRPKIDLEIVRTREIWESEYVSVSPLSRLSQKSFWQYIAAWFITTQVSMLMLIKVPSNWIWARLVVAGLLGAAIGVFAMIHTNCISMRRRDIQPPLSYQAWIRECNSRRQDSMR